MFLGGKSAVERRKKPLLEPVPGTNRREAHSRRLAVAQPLTLQPGNAPLVLSLASPAAKPDFGLFPLGGLCLWERRAISH